MSDEKNQEQPELTAEEAKAVIEAINEVEREEAEESAEE